MIMMIRLDKRQSFSPRFFILYIAGVVVLHTNWVNRNVSGYFWIFVGRLAISSKLKPLASRHWFSSTIRPPTPLTRRADVRLLGEIAIEINHAGGSRCFDSIVTIVFPPFPHLTFFFYSLLNSRLLFYGVPTGSYTHLTQPLMAPSHAIFALFPPQLF